MTENEPQFITPLGAIAYRLDAIATGVHCLGVAYGADDAFDLAAKLWGAMDDLVAYGLIAEKSARG